MEEANKKESFFGEILRFILVSLAIVIPIRMFIAEPFVVSGSSMHPTFETGHYLIVDQVSYRFDDPQRGDIIVFHYPKDPKKFFIKRVIGLPGEVVEISEGKVLVKNDVYTDGLLLEEPYVKDLSNENIRLTLGADEYFVMGDNRTASSDSRVWGPLSENLIVGKALIRLFPITNLSILPGDYNHE